MTSNVEQAASALITGGIAAFPTETVYGLGASVFDEDAVRGVFRAKGRPADNPLIVHIHDISQLREIAARVPADAKRLMAKFFPGPLTVVLPKHRYVPRVVTAGLETVAVRMPRHPVARKFLKACGFPVAAPSANRSGRPSPTSWQAARDDLGGRIPCILKGGRSPVGLESTVVDCTGQVPVVLRAGAVSLEQIRKVVPSARMAGPRDLARGRSPGLKHRHYSPKGEVRVQGPRLRQGFGGQARSKFQGGATAWIGTGRPPAGVKFAKRCRDAREYARELFHFFRRCDAARVRIILCEAVPERGIGAALMDRIRRAARKHDRHRRGTLPRVRGRVALGTSLNRKFAKDAKRGWTPINTDVAGVADPGPSSPRPHRGRLQGRGTLPRAL